MPPAPYHAPDDVGGTSQAGMSSDTSRGSVVGEGRGVGDGTGKGSAVDEGTGDACGSGVAVRVGAGPGDGRVTDTGTVGVAVDRGAVTTVATGVGRSPGVEVGLSSPEPHAVSIPKATSPSRLNANVRTDDRNTSHMR